MKPLLASAIEDTSSLKYPLSISVKLDGIRCLIIDGVAVSRNLKPIRNAHVQKMFGKAEYNGWDGELLVGPANAPDVYLVTNSGVMSASGEPDVKFYVFDRWDMPDTEYSKRYDSIGIADDDTRALVKVKQRIAVNEAELLQFEQEVLNQGYEGVMVRRFCGPLSHYKYGRSTLKEATLLKLKRMVSDEAEIIDVIELERNMNEAVVNALGHIERSACKENKLRAGVMGALAVRCLTSGAMFQIGTGFSAADREWFWVNKDRVLGQFVTYNHFPIGKKDLPRFPSYKGLRSVEDM